MRFRNETGQGVVLFVLLTPLFLLLLVMSVEFSRIVLTKIKLQGTVDKAVFAGASALSEALNQIALSNRKVHRQFLDLSAKFKGGSKKSDPSAKTEIAETWSRQNQIFEEEIEPLLEKSYARAYAIANQVVEEEFPQAHLLPFYSAPIQIGEGSMNNLIFGKIQGITMDPTGHKTVSKTGFEARIAFTKNIKSQVALAAGLEFQTPMFIIPFLRLEKPLQAVAAAEPYGGSVWDYALEEKDSRLYRTAMVPLKSLSPEGYKNFIPIQKNNWEGFNPYAVQH